MKSMHLHHRLALSTIKSFLLRSGTVLAELALLIGGDDLNEVTKPTKHNSPLIHDDHNLEHLI